MEKIKIYLAGKIEHTCWRHTLFPDLRNISGPFVYGDYKYSGPFFISCDHGCFHGDASHGRGLNNEDYDPDGTCGYRADRTRDETVQKCFAQIKSADYVFAWIDSPDAYGTLVELGFAKGNHIPIFVAFNHRDWVKPNKNNYINEMWFLQKAADFVVYEETPKEAWKKFHRWVHGITRMNSAKIRYQGQLTVPTGV